MKRIYSLFIRVLPSVPVFLLVPAKCPAGILTFPKPRIEHPPNVSSLSDPPARVYLPARCAIVIATAVSPDAGANRAKGETQKSRAKAKVESEVNEEERGNVSHIGILNRRRYTPAICTLFIAFSYSVMFARLL